MAKIAENVETKFLQAFKKKDQKAISALRLAKTALTNERIAKMHQLSEEEEMAVIRREVKKHEEAAAIFEQAGEMARAADEREESSHLQEFLPPELSDDSIKNAVKEVIAEQGAKTVGDFGRVMGAVMKKLSGQASGDKVGKIVKEELQKINS